MWPNFWISKQQNGARAEDLSLLGARGGKVLEANCNPPIASPPKKWQQHLGRVKQPAAGCFGLCREGKTKSSPAHLPGVLGSLLHIWGLKVNWIAACRKEWTLATKCYQCPADAHENSNLSWQDSDIFSTASALFFSRYFIPEPYLTTSPLRFFFSFFFFLSEPQCF